MIEIDYPGSGNKSVFGYDPSGKNASTVETLSGSITRTSQFLWNRRIRCEERDASGAISAQFFTDGEVRAGSMMFFSEDHLGTVREITDGAGLPLAEYGFDPYGRKSVIMALANADFGFAKYFEHQRSSLELTQHRFYNPGVGAWLSRDPIGEAGGNNLFSYVSNSPSMSVDPLGLLDMGGAVSRLIQVGRDTTFDPVGGPLGGPQYGRGPKVEPQNWEHSYDPDTIPAGNRGPYNRCIENAHKRADELFGKNDSPGKDNFLKCEIQKCLKDAGAKGGWRNRSNPNVWWDDDENVPVTHT